MTRKQLNINKLSYSGDAHCFSWATCLNDAPTKTRPDLDHEARFKDEPGQSWGAKRQCEVLLRDKDATLLNPDRLQVKIIVSFLFSF